jgi:hypothetical protein
VAISNIVSISAGGDDAMALGSDGTLWVWDRNDNLQLGIQQHSVESSGIDICRCDCWRNSQQLCNRAKWSYYESGFGTINYKLIECFVRNGPSWVFYCVYDRIPNCLDH